jgi:hypothetical protein
LLLLRACRRAGARVFATLEHHTGRDDSDE